MLFVASFHFRNFFLYFIFRYDSHSLIATCETQKCTVTTFIPPAEFQDSQLDNLLLQLPLSSKTAPLETSMGNLFVPPAEFEESQIDKVLLEVPLSYPISDSKKSIKSNFIPPEEFSDTCNEFDKLLLDIPLSYHSCDTNISDFPSLHRSEIISNVSSETNISEPGEMLSNVSSETNISEPGEMLSNVSSDTNISELPSPSVTEILSTYSSDISMPACSGVVAEQFNEVLDSSGSLMESERHLSDMFMDASSGETEMLRLFIPPDEFTKHTDEDNEMLKLSLNFTKRQSVVETSCSICQPTDYIFDVSINLHEVNVLSTSPGNINSTASTLHRNK